MRTPPFPSSLASAAVLAALPLALAKSFINWDAHEYPIVQGFSWSKPFPDNDGTPPMGFDTICNADKTFYAKNYKLSDLKGGELAPYGEAVERAVAGRAYPGSWDGVDHGGRDRDLYMMEWLDVPLPVRAWIEKQLRKEDLGKRWRFMVFRKPAKTPGPGEVDVPTATAVAPVPTEGTDASTWEMPQIPDKEMVVFFAPGQLYDILPLWVAKGSKCEAQFLDLSQYHPHAKDESVIAWPYEHSKPDRPQHKLDVFFRIRAEAVRETEHGRHMREMWEAMMRTVRRHERRREREERYAARNKVGGAAESRHGDEL